MKKICLSCYDNDRLSGLLIPFKTSVVWEQQCGGTACYHESLEGLFFPIPNSFEQEEDPFYDLTNIKGERRRELTNKLLETLDLAGCFEFEEDETLVAHEAWIPVKIKSKCDFLLSSVISDFAGYRAILTYNNSD